MASSSILVLQIGERMQIWRKVLFYAHRQVEERPSKRCKKKGDKSAVAMLKITRKIGLRISGCGAAEVFIDFAEELKHTETNPMCKIHKSRRTSR